MSIQTNDTNIAKYHTIADRQCNMGLIELYENNGIKSL